MNNSRTKHLKPPKRLRIVPMGTPWGRLQAELTGDSVHDAEVIRRFCQNFGISKNTAYSKLKLRGINKSGAD
jgi:hypothetical protein